MSEFDPYHKWLGIPPKDQPPNHYRLLGIELFESDPDVIDAAAEQRSSFIRQCATGQHLKHSQRLLNEVAAARLTLIKERDRNAYDVALRRRLQPALPSEIHSSQVMTASAIAKATEGSTHAPARGARPAVEPDAKDVLRKESFAKTTEAAGSLAAIQPASSQPATIQDLSVGSATALSQAEDSEFRSDYLLRAACLLGLVPIALLIISLSFKPDPELPSSNAPSPRHSLREDSKYDVMLLWVKRFLHSCVVGVAALSIQLMLKPTSKLVVIAFVSSAMIDLLRNSLLPLIWSVFPRQITWLVTTSLPCRVLLLILPLVPLAFLNVRGQSAAIRFIALQSIFLLFVLSFWEPLYLMIASPKLAALNLFIGTLANWAILTASELLLRLQTVRKIIYSPISEILVSFR